MLKEVDVLEERARESMGARQYSELRTSIARPEREPSTIAHLLVTESPESLLLATEISERKSCGMLRKNERLKEKLMALFPDLHV